MVPPPGPVVSTDWLAQALGSPGLVVLDASWYLPAAGRDAPAEFQTSHLPGALFFDIDAMSDTASPLPHMLPAPEKFATRVGALGIGKNDVVVVYDGAGLFSAPRVWWMFRAMGHDAVAVLDGGLPKWRAEGRPLNSDTAVRPPQRFTARFRPDLIRDADAVLANVTSPRETVVDARSAPRFAGAEPEPRPGVRAGHIPGSRNVPYSAVLAPDGTLRPPGEIRTVFAQAGVDLAGPVVTSCGSGVTAALLALALQTAGVPDVPIYDGSWSEWGARTDLPVERTGASQA